MKPKEILEFLLQHYQLSATDSRLLMEYITNGNFNPAQLASVLTVFRMRPVTLTELENFREVLLERSVQLDFSDIDPIDVCGTGGDGKNSFNISTLAAFVAAGAGVPVAKHGNHGVSGPTGSSTVLEQLGIHFTSDKDQLREQLEKSGICFLHAPLFHPALQRVSGVRRDLGMKTVFNMLGPLVNPARPRRQLAGVYNLELARTYAYFFQRHHHAFAVVHSLDGYDEVSLTSAFRLFTSGGERLLRPEDLGVDSVKQEDLYSGKDPRDAAKLFMEILSGKSDPKKEQIVCANAALAIRCRFEGLRIEDAFSLATESLRSGKALQSFQQFKSLAS